MSLVFTHRVKAALNELQGLRRLVADEARQVGVRQETIDDMLIAMNEAVTNIILHGYQGGAGTIQVVMDYEDGDLVVTLLDRAPAFDPTLLPDPDVTLPLERRPCGGLGVYIMRRLVDELSYRFTPDGENELTLVIREDRKS